jgi:hypothetical protein
MCVLDILFLEYVLNNVNLVVILVKKIKLLKYSCHDSESGVTVKNVPYILESNLHPFYSFRGLKNRMRIRFVVKSWILEKCFI